MYTVLRIEEDFSFGCEARSDDSPVMAVVTLCDEDGRQTEVKSPDAWLYRDGINEGDRVLMEAAPTLPGAVLLRHV